MAAISERAVFRIPARSSDELLPQLLAAQPLPAATTAASQRGAEGGSALGCQVRSPAKGLGNKTWLSI